MIDADRLPPQNLEAERAVIGSALLDSGTIDEMAGIVTPEDFWRDTHGLLWKAILTLWQDRKPVDALTLIDHLETAGHLKRAGGEETIQIALEQTPSSANSLYYAQIVRQRSIARRVIEVANETLKEAYSGSFASDELLESLQKRAMAVDADLSGQGPISAASLVDDSLARFERNIQGGGGGGILLGMSSLDRMLGGFRSGSMYVLAGRPASGKSAFSLNIAEHIARAEQQPVLFFSMEMSASELSDRLLCTRSRVAGELIRVPAMAPEEDRFKFRQAARIARDLPLWVEDSATMTCTKMASIARRFQAAHGLIMVVVDYVSLLKAENPREPRHEQVAGFSRSLAAMAKELKVPVVVLAQLNRETEKREDKRPRLSDLRESGQIEQDAYAVLMIHRPEYYNPTDQPGIAEIILAKNRGGPSGMVRMAYHKSITRFADLGNDLPDDYPF